VTDERKFQEEMGEYGVGREKRLKEREGKLEKDEKSNYGLAFLEAGLAMMGGESPNAFANITKGALQGMGRLQGRGWLVSTTAKTSCSTPTTLWRCQALRQERSVFSY